MHTIYYLLKREWQLLLKDTHRVMTSLMFFFITVSMFSLMLSYYPMCLSEFSYSILWLCIFLAAFIALPALIEHDLRDGSLAQIYLTGTSLEWLIVTKSIAHWVSVLLPMVLSIPLLLPLFSVPFELFLRFFSILMLATPLISILGVLGGVLLAGSKQGAGMLIYIVITPLTIPVIIFSLLSLAEPSWIYLGSLALLWLLLIPFSLLFGGMALRAHLREA